MKKSEMENKIGTLTGMINNITAERDDLFFFLDRVLEIMDVYTKLKSGKKSKKQEEVNMFFLQKNIRLLLSFYCDFYFSTYETPDGRIEANIELEKKWEQVIRGVEPLYTESVKKILSKYDASYIT